MMCPDSFEVRGHNCWELCLQQHHPKKTITFPKPQEDWGQVDSQPQTRIDIATIEAEKRCT